MQDYLSSYESQNEFIIGQFFSGIRYLDNEAGEGTAENSPKLPYLMTYGG